MISNVQSIIEALKKRLTKENTLLKQCLGGGLIDTKFIFNPPAEESEIESFCKKLGIVLPEDYKSFLLIHNGARIFTEIRIFGLDDIYQLYIKDDFKSILPLGWIPIGDDLTGYHFIVDTSNLKHDSKYKMYHTKIIGSDKEINLTFEEWLDRLCVCSGDEFWYWS